MKPSENHKHVLIQTERNLSRRQLPSALGLVATYTNVYRLERDEEFFNFCRITPGSAGDEASPVVTWMTGYQKAASAR